MRLSIQVTIFCLIMAGLPALATAEVYNPDKVCEAPTRDLSPTQLLRSLSLDLRGTIPTMDEYAEVQEAGKIPESLIDKWLKSDAFVDQAVRFHGAILWPNLTGLRLVSRNMQLSRENGTELYYRRVAATAFRGERVPCRDEPEPDDTLTEIVKLPYEDGTMREGYVWREPYWAPGTLIKVCAWDAQAIEVSPTGKACDELGAQNDPKCGCGPELKWCSWGNGNNLRNAFLEDLNRRIASVIKEDRPYTDLLTETAMYVNGPLVHYFRYQAQLSDAFRMVPYTIPVALLPDLHYLDSDTWVKIPLPQYHSGVLTSPAFLLRFQTNRARANEYQVNYLCEPFQPPAGGLPAATDEEALEPDLQKRPGCKYCHTILEPEAAYWGRWPESATGYLDPGNYPAFDLECQECAMYGGCSTRCNRYYIVNALTVEEEPYFGWLKGYLFRSDVDMDNVEEGPHLLVKRTTYNQRMPTCVVNHTMRWLAGREARTEESAWLGEVVATFMGSDLSFRSMVKALVTSPLYRRVQ